MTATTTAAAYDDDQIEVGACTGCLTLADTDELRGCGTHTLCPECLATTSCTECSLIRHEEAADRAEQADYDASRDDYDYDYDEGGFR